MSYRIMRAQFWPGAIVVITPTYPDDDGSDGLQPMRFPWARKAALAVLGSDAASFVTRFVLDAALPFEVVCAVPRTGDDFAADEARVREIIDRLVASA